MLDNDFCDINRLAAKHLEHQSTARDEAWDAASQTPQTWDAFGKLKWETLLSFSYFYK